MEGGRERAKSLDWEGIKLDENDDEGLDEEFWIVGGRFDPMGWYLLLVPDDEE